MKRPFCVTILLWLVLSLTAWSGFRLWSALHWWGELQRFGTPPRAAYIAVSGGGGLVAGISLLWGMWRRKAWTRIGLMGAAIGFTMWYWCDRLFLQSPRANWPFALVTTIILLVITTICTWLPSTKVFFSEDFKSKFLNHR